MKGRAQASISLCSNEWGEESWTVDCPCGVNFDDGEEMVDCDECGVWVHTSCCRILKGHTSYVCDKCKSKKRKELVETEVAQLLLDLPSKAPALEEKVSDKAEDCPIAFQNAAERSMEERAHVQGIPGGDASMFVGVSKVFSRQLWKYTGYIPKALSLSYNELPEWPRERANTFSLFADCCQRQTDEPVPVCLKDEFIPKPEDERRSDAENLADIHLEPQQPSREKHGKREGRKAESRHGNHRHKLHGSKEDRGHHHNKRKREEKDLGSKKRAKNYVVGTKAVEGTGKKSGSTQDELFSFRSTRPLSNNPKAMRRLAVQNYIDEDVTILNCSKVEPLSAHDHGCTVGDIVTSNEDCDKLPGVSKNIKFEKQVDGNVERELLSSLPGTSMLDAVSTLDAGDHEETKFQDCKVGEEFTTPSKQVEIPNISIKKVHSLSEKKGYTIGVGVDTEITVVDNQEQLQSGAKHITTADAAEVNTHVGSMAEVQLEGRLDIRKLSEERFSPSQQLQSTAPINERASGQLIKENAFLASDKQHLTGLNEPVSAEVQTLGKYTEHSQGKLGRSTHKKHRMAADTLQSSMEEKTRGGQLFEEHLDNLACEHSSGLEELAGQENLHKIKGHDHKSSPLVSLSHQEAGREDVNAHSKLHASNSSVSATTSGKLQSIDGGSPNASSPLSVHTLSVKTSFNVNSCSSPSSSVALKPQQGFTKSNSGSPPFEKIGSGVPINIVPPTMVSKATSLPLSPTNIKPSVSSGTRCPSIASGTGLSVSNAKETSKTNILPESKKAEVSSTRHPTKEPTKLSVNPGSKVTALGKTPSVPVVSKNPAHLKGHNSFPSSRHTGLTSSKQEITLSKATPEQVVLSQSRQPSFLTRQGPNNTSVRGEKMGVPFTQMLSKTMSVQPLPHPVVTADKQSSVANSTAHDEELALLLHQELNSSPRVPRVARIRQHVTSSQLVSSSQTSVKRPMVATASAGSGTSQKEHPLASRRTIRDDSSRDSSRGSFIASEDALKVEACTIRKPEETKVLTAGTKDGTDLCAGQKVVTVPNATEVSSYPSPLASVSEGQFATDTSGANDSPNGGEKKCPAETITTLPGLIEEILNDKCHQTSYDYICEAVLPHWPKLRKPNGDRYAYTSHRQAVLDCLRNRSAWSHLIDRGPKTNLGRKRRRHESITAIESENDEDVDGKACILDDELENPKLAKPSKDSEAGRSNCCGSDKSKSIDVALPEDVPKGKRKARRRRRLALHAKGDGSVHKKEKHRHKEVTEAIANIEDHELILSPLSEEAASNDSEDEEDILVHRGSRYMNRRQGSSVESEDDTDL